MSEKKAPLLTGGCQCGAVRYACYAGPSAVSICHCRMCQKAVGGPFATFAEIRREDFAWTRGGPQTFRSSSLVERDFCGNCGTPLSSCEIGGPVIYLSTGSFDAPGRVVPTIEFGAESKLAWMATAKQLPSKTTAESLDAAKLSRIVSYQHPDHDTQDGWSPPPPLKDNR